MTCGAKLPMAVSGVPHGYALHELAERLIMNLHQRMKVIGHPAERMQACKTAAQAVGEDVVQNVAVLARPEEIFAMVSKAIFRCRTCKTSKTSRYPLPIVASLQSCFADQTSE